MQEQLRRAGKPGPKVVGIDEISIRKRHTYRIVVSDLVPIWFGGKDREASMDEFFEWRDPGKERMRCHGAKPFRTSTHAAASCSTSMCYAWVKPWTACAESETRLTGKHRRFIKGVGARFRDSAGIPEAMKLLELDPSQFDQLPSLL